LISEHDALVRYLARKFKPELLGKNDSDFALVEQYLCFWVKLNMEAVTLCYTPGVTDEQREGLLKKYEAKL